MITEIYFIILLYFILGGLGFFFINRKKPREKAKQSYIKFGTYFIIINLIFFSITLQKDLFRYLAILLTAAGAIELTSLYFKSKSTDHRCFYIGSMLIFLVIGSGFISFSMLPKEYLLYSFLVLSIFDSFSQIAGQIFGRRKILPKISPNKTLEGLIGGAFIALVSTYWLNDLLNQSFMDICPLSLGIILFAFLGDVAASYYKRKFQVKDFNNLIPGHGGFLDRFDSLILAGAWSWIGITLLHI